VRDRDVRRELYFSVALLFLYPVPILWACLVLVDDCGSGIMPYFLGLTFVVELFSAVERTLLLRGLERTTLRIRSDRIEKAVGSRVEAVLFSEVASVSVRRAFFLGRPVAAIVRSTKGQTLYLPGFGLLKEALALLRQQVGDDKFAQTGLGRAVFVAGFFTFLAGAAAALANGLLPANLTALLVFFSAGVLLLRHPFHRVLGLVYRPYDRALAVVYLGTGIIVCSGLAVGFVHEQAVLRQAQHLVEKEGALGQGIHLLGKIEGEEALKHLLVLSRDADPLIRREAVLALGPIDDSRVVRRLRQALDDGDLVVRRYAAFGLGCRADKAQIPPLIGVLMRSKEDPEVLSAANASLERLTHASFLPYLTWSRLDEPDRLLLVDFWTHHWREKYGSPPSGEKKGE